MIWLLYAGLIAAILVLEFHERLIEKLPWLKPLKVFLFIIAFFSGALQIGMLAIISILIAYQVVLSPLLYLVYIIYDLIYKPNYDLPLEKESKTLEEEYVFHKIYKRYCKKNILKIQTFRIFAVVILVMLIIIIGIVLLSLYSHFSFIGPFGAFVAVGIILFSVKSMFKIEINENNFIVSLLRDYLLESQDNIDRINRNISSSERTLSFKKFGYEFIEKQNQQENSGQDSLI